VEARKTFRERTRHARDFGAADARGSFGNEVLETSAQLPKSNCALPCGSAVCRTTTRRVEVMQRLIVAPYEIVQIRLNRPVCGWADRVIVLKDAVCSGADETHDASLILLGDRFST
jgi:hypothetical protein